MDSANFQNSLEALLRRTPFQPFTVELANGVRLKVEQPETVALNGGLAVHISREGAPTFFDASSVSDLAGSNADRPRAGFG
jgi:hypothetical protein